MDFTMIIMLVVMIAIFYFLIIRPEKKKKKEEEALRSSLNEGDKITTIGGIIGKIVQMKDDNIVIETSEDRVRMELAKWSVMTNNTAQEKAQKARADAQAAAKERAAKRKQEKEEKKKNKKNKGPEV
ncbi:MAG: preprotein translocase subunit YajC [Oscillospiraceae bacterium]|nr:preprotein translocase subunit YajC [Oscillospiraceae bacterium]